MKNQLENFELPELHQDICDIFLKRTNKWGLVKVRLQTITSESIIMAHLMHPTQNIKTTCGLISLAKFILKIKLLVS